MLRQRQKPNFFIWLFVIILITSSSYVDGKRSWSSNSRKTSGGYSTHRKPSSPSSGHGVTRPGGSHGSSSNVAHPDPKVFSYPNTHPKTPAAAPPQIGWNVHNQRHNQGPPPAYSAVNPSGGAKANIYEKPPPYNPNYAPPQRNPATVGGGHIGNSGSSSPGSSSNSGSTINRAAAPVLHNRGTNSTGFSGSGVHTPLSPTQNNNLQSSYPRQTPVQTASGQHIGGVNYQPGSQPVGGYYPQLPGYQQPGALPPAGPHYHQPTGSYYPSPGHYAPPAGVPPGGTYIPGNAAIPQGAILVQSPPKSSSGLGFGSGAVVGAIGGAILANALTPTHTRVIDHVPVNNNPGSSGTNDDKIIIINNAPPGSVTAQDVGSGTTVITTAQQAVPGAPSQSGVPASQPIPPQSQPMAPSSQPVDSSAGAPLAPMQPIPSATSNNTPLAPFGSSQPPSQDQATPPANVGNPAAQQPPYYCVDQTVNDTNGNPILQTYCYPVAIQPQAPAASTGAAGATEPIPSTPGPGNGMVPLAPMNHQSTPDLMKNPSGDDKISTARLSENSMIKTASGAENQKVSKGFIYSTLLIFLSAFCLH